MIILLVRSNKLAKKQACLLTKWLLEVRINLKKGLFTSNFKLSENFKKFGVLNKISNKKLLIFCFKFWLN